MSKATTKIPVESQRLSPLPAGVEKSTPAGSGEDNKPIKANIDQLNLEIERLLQKRGDDYANATRSIEVLYAKRRALAEKLK